MRIEDVRNKNPQIKIRDITDRSFLKFGRIVDEHDFSDLIEYVLYNAPIGGDGNIYVASLPELEAYPVCRKVKEEFYGGMELEAGYCTGKNSALNGLEYHKGSEIDCAATDLILLLGNIWDINGSMYDSIRVEAFYVPKGYAVELYATTLHFAPCRVDDGGFKAVIILPKGTNEPIEKTDRTGCEGKLLFMKNKWLIVHSSKKELIDKGAHPGILGENIEIYL